MQRWVLTGTDHGSVDGANSIEAEERGESGPEDDRSRRERDEGKRGRPQERRAVAEGGTTHEGGHQKEERGQGDPPRGPVYAAELKSSW